MMTTVVEDDKPCLLWNDEILSFDPLPAVQDLWTVNSMKEQMVSLQERINSTTSDISAAHPPRLSVETPTGSPIAIDFTSNILSPKKPRVAVRVPTFDGKPYDFPVERLLSLDASGIPSLAVPILDYGTKNGWSIEALLKKATIGQYNTAVRYWFKGQNLSRQSVLEGAAVLVEWYESVQQDRPRRNVTVDVSKVPEYMKKIALSSKSKRLGNSKKKMITPNLDHQPLAPTAKRPKFMEPETMTPKTSTISLLRPVSPLPERTLPIKFYSLFDEDEEDEALIEFPIAFQTDVWQAYFDSV